MTSSSIQLNKGFIPPHTSPTMHLITSVRVWGVGWTMGQVSEEAQSPSYHASAQGFTIRRHR